MKYFTKLLQVSIIIATGVIGYTVYYHTIMSNELDSMHVSIDKDLEYCKHFIDSEFQLLQEYCDIWAESPDIQSLTNPYNNLHDKNLLATIQNRMPIDFLSVIDPSGNIVYCEQQEKAGNDFIIAGLPEFSTQPVNGLIKGNRDIYMIAIAPVFNPNDNTAKATLLFARRMDQQFVQSMQQYIDSEIICTPINAQSGQTDVHTQLPAGTQVRVYNHQDKKLSVSMVYTDIYGNKVLSVSLKKQYTANSQVHNAGLWTIITVCFSLIIGFLLLNKFSSQETQKEFFRRFKAFITGSPTPKIKRFQIDLDEISQTKTNIHENIRQKEQFVRLQNDILFDLARMNNFNDESLNNIINKITESTADFLEVDRVCIWVFNETCSSINLFDLYNHRLNIHTNGDIVEADKLPTFCDALQKGAHISVKDASQDPRLKEFFEHYLSPEGISSVLDVPISFGDKIRGVLCHEHIGPQREWTRYEERYASSIADLISIIFDKFEHKKMEDAFHKTTQIESIGLIAGGIGHDFNNLLTAILGNCSLAMMSCPPDSTQYEFLENIEKASNRARDLSQQLLNFSKEGTPIKKSASILEVIHESSNFSLKGSNVKCEIHAHKSLWNVEIDKGQISQVINNLIINANHAMPDGGKITVTCSNITLKTPRIPNLTTGKYVKIIIQDQGIGIPHEHQSKIFDPYFTTKQQGSGLGLATCYSIMRKHKGHISVNSEPGMGTAFSIYLPASTTKSNEQIVVEEQSEIKSGQGTILIMDDDEMVRSVLGQTIATFGYNVMYAKDGEETLDIIEKSLKDNTTISAVIMDLTIPGGMGGKETIKRLKEIAPSIKTFVSSGYSNDPIMNEFENYGFNGVISKPVDVHSLNMTLHSVLSH